MSKSKGFRFRNDYKFSSYCIINNLSFFLGFFIIHSGKLYGENNLGNTLHNDGFQYARLVEYSFVDVLPTGD